MKTPKISLGSWAFSFGPFEKSPWSFEAVSQYCAEAGYDGIEINGFRPHPHPDDYNNRGKCAELKQQLDDLGLGISGYAPDFRHVPPSEAETSAYLNEVGKMLRFMNLMNIETLRVDTSSPPFEHSPAVYEERFSRLVRNWRVAAEACGEAGVVMVWEYEPGFWLNKPSEVKRAVEAVGHDHFKLLFDTSHSYMGAVVGARQTGESEILSGGVAEYARFLKDHIGHFHLIDSDGTLHGDETSTHTPFGEGYIDFKEVLAALRPALDNLEWWCVDFCFCRTTEKDGKRAISFIKKLAETI
jgi:sugar phosphate isomerase/epimerase